MKDISVYFTPVSDEFLPQGEERTTVGHFTRFYAEGKSFPDLSDVNIAIIGVKEDRGNPENRGSAEGPDFVRSRFYSLRRGIMVPSIADLGNILPGASAGDTYFALQEVINELLRKQILPVIIGDCDVEELSWTIGMFQAIDMRVYNAASYQHLFQTWGIGYAP